METLGAMVDRLSILNIKIYMVQEFIHEAKNTDPATFCSRHTPEEMHAKMKALADLNLERNRVMTQIDRCLADGLATGKTPVDLRWKSA